MIDSSPNQLFQSLDIKTTPWTRLACSLAVNSAIVIALLAIPATVTQTIHPAHVTTVSLIAPPIAPYIPAPRPVIKVKAPVIPPPPVKTEKKIFQAPVVKTQQVQQVKLPPAPVEAPKPVEVAKIEAPKIELPKKVDVLPAANEATPAPVPVRPVKVGDFGDPNGVPAVQASNKSPLVQAGSFDLSQGSGHAAGSGGNGKTLVASAGFGSGYGSGSGAASGSGGKGNSGVRAGGFGDYDGGAAHVVKVAAKPSAPAETPVEITYKPKPAYTPEAREKKIEGDVQLEVLFSSAGQIQILRLVRGLGYGLDENARAAASQIRFRPGTRNGAPVDMTGTVHIIFQIS